MSAQYVITELSIDGLVAIFAGRSHPERTPIGPFHSREAAWEYASRMQVKYGNGGGSVEVSVLHEPEELAR